MGLQVKTVQTESLTIGPATIKFLRIFRNRKQFKKTPQRQKNSQSAPSVSDTMSTAHLFRVWCFRNCTNAHLKAHRQNIIKSMCNSI